MQLDLAFFVLDMIYYIIMIFRYCEDVQFSLSNM